MANVAFVQSYPYEARYGGDAEYIIRLAQFMQDIGHKVHFLISNIHRGRTLPFYVSPYPIDEFTSYAVRGGARVGRFVTDLIPAHPVERLAQRIMPGLRGRADEISEAEADWLVKRIDAIGAEVVVLCFGGTNIAPRLLGQGRCVVALPSFLPGRGLHLKGASAALTRASALPADFVRPLGSADIVVVNADDEAHALQPLLPEKDIVVAKIGMPFRESTPGPGATVLFVGNDTGPNVLAARWFVSEVWPRVLPSVTGARLRLVGRVAAMLPEGGANVDLVGPVESLAGEYGGAHAVVAPLREGSAGVKIKVAEAISFGCPLVTTSVGVDPAIPDQIDEAGFVANTPQAFAECLRRLLTDPELRAEKARGARAVHARHFSHQASYGELMRRIEAFTGRGQPLPAPETRPGA